MGSISKEFQYPTMNESVQPFAQCLFRMFLLPLASHGYEFQSHSRLRYHIRPPRLRVTL